MRHATPPSADHRSIDALSRQDALSAMLASQAAAVAAVEWAVSEIDAAADIVARGLEAGSTLYYAAAGSSGLMALADASELPGTFGVPQAQIRICMAGGVPVDAVMPGDTEDDETSARELAGDMQAGDVAIVLSASGTTPFALAFAQQALARGAQVICIANVKDSALLALGHVAIALDTGAEVLAGSTRLGAGTAQKVALNMMSTQAGVLLGHVHEGLMVNLQPDNIKLRKRAADIVQKITGVSPTAAQDALVGSDHNAKLAILLAMGCELERGRALLSANGGRLRACIQHLDTPSNTTT